MFRSLCAKKVLRILLRQPIENKEKVVKLMSLSMLKMWVSIAGMGLLAIAMFTIYFSRYKIKSKIFKVIAAIIAYICLIVGGLIMVYVILS